ncbi:MAG: enoyl-CoA hydratase/isomerase family protein [Flexistipes sinusarabici]|uniref:Enoyl-CoA hydratase/isomerase family protein n=3 Tax=Flexistipes sinusarabici TaxID=2352 RepID=A0A5D0MRT6_FLESI|nr:enoyl-CoA hydratase/isomerase family protein [Flexistipes sinusarabici]TYB33679.1 MAG: enoyl-CoA hydratase/isomerase family protein [Flexistipes sinusarabici]
MIELKIKEETAKLNLYPDKKFNILEPETIRELYNNIASLSETPVKVLRIFGHGGSFAVGANILTMLKYSGYTAKGFSMLGNKLFGLLDNIPQVVIAEIDGFCMGGGMDFASSCDFRFATTRSRFAHPGSKLGIITGFGGTQRISRLMKSRHFIEHFITGDPYSAKFMKEGGFLSETFENAENMHSYADKFTGNITNKNRLFLAELKKSINKQR